MRLFRKGTNIGLRIKLVLLIESLVILLVLATGIITTIREKQTFENELEKRGLALSANLANFVVRPLINQDLPALRRFVNHSMAQDYVRYVIVLDPNGQVVMHSDLEEVGKTYNKSAVLALGARGHSYTHPHLSKQGELHCDIFTPIQLSGVRLGTVALGYSYAAVERQIATAHQQVFVIGLAMTLIGAVAAYLLATFISTPVRRITMAVEKVADGEPYFPLKIKRRDEIGILANSFDEMAEDLEKHRRHLEELVQERTTDLQRVNERLRQEISDRKEAEAALRQSEKHYRETFDAMTDWILAVDSDLRIVLFNDAFMQINKELGLTTDVIGRTPMEIFPFLSHTLPYEYRWVFENKKVLITQETTRVGNREFITESRKIPLLEEGRISKVVSVIRNITERKIAEEAVQESVRRMQVAYDQSVVYAQQLNEEIEGRKRAQEALIHAKEDWENTFDAITEMVMLLDNEHQIIRVNRAAAQALNTTKENLVGKKCYEAIHGKSRPIRRCPLVRTMKTLEPRTSEIAEPNLGGTFICSTSPILDLEGKLTGYTHTLKDITESKRLEAQLLQAQKMEAIGSLAGGVAHDLNNILAGIVSYPDLLLMQIPEDSPLTKPILTMKESGKKAADIVQDLLTLARRGVATTEVANLNDIISEYLKSPEHQKLKLYHAEVEVETTLETDLLHILGSPVHLSKTVMNLISNAAEAMTDGGKVLISTENRYVDRPIRGYDDVEEGDYVTLTVSDSGVGIPSEDLGRIFEPFYTKKKMGRSGTGLGMAVVWGTVKDHKGYIDVQSSEGEGTTITLYFPATRQQPLKDQSGPSVEDYMGSGQSILVVDDVKEQREIAFTILSELGYSVTTVSSGEEAVEYMKNNSVDLLVLDMIMDPNIDGLDTYKQILELHPGQKSIIASGFSETDRLKEAQKLGAGQYIKKPYTLEKIGIVVKAELEK